MCPLCDTPIPIKRGEMPDIKVGEHIDRDCKSDPAQRKRKVSVETTGRALKIPSYCIEQILSLLLQIFTNKCSKGGCKQKEMIRVTCDQCRLNYCLKHRHPLDHECKPDGKPLSDAGWVHFTSGYANPLFDILGKTCLTLFLPHASDGLL